MGFLFTKKSDKAVARWHHTIVETSRQPAFYTTGQVPDTLDGRYDLLALHLFLGLMRLKNYPEEGRKLLESVFAQLDLNLRELGVGDTGVGKRIRAMMEGFYGRFHAYEAGLADDAVLHEALSRNLFGTWDIAPTLDITQPFVNYIRQNSAALAAQLDADILQGTLAFTPFNGEKNDGRERI